MNRNRENIVRLFGPGDQLAELRKLLEAGEPIPAWLTQTCVPHLMALERDGKLPAERSAGRPSKNSEGWQRAYRVACRHILHGERVKDAIPAVARECEIDSETVRKNYGRWGKSARSFARMVKNAPTFEAECRLLIESLQTFRGDDGQYIRRDAADEIAGALPVTAVKPLNKKIADAPLRRDVRLLKEYLSQVTG